MAVKLMRSLGRMVLAFAMMTGGLASVEAAYPDRPIHLIVPYPPGGLTDAVARQVGRTLADRVGQPVIVDNVPGGGGTSHLAGEMFNIAADVKITHVPYKGSGPALQDLMGGQIQMMFNDTSLPQIKAETLRALAVTGSKRWSQLPDVPTMSELGIPSQALSPDQHVAFAERFGPLEPNINSYGDDVKRDRVDSRVSDVSNLSEDNEILNAQSRKRLSGLANRLWHTDSSFRHVAARVSLLHARTVAPIGGHTEFADLRAAWDALPDDMKRRIDGLIVEHSIFHSRAKLGFTDYSDRERAALPGAKQLLVRTIPETDRKSLYLASHAMRVVGMDETEGARLIEELTAFATQRQFVYTHRWRVNDLVAWDNRCTMHRGTAFEERRWKRDMLRATVTDVGNTCAGLQGSEALPP